jgi:hypothetical protein
LLALEDTPESKTALTKFKFTLQEDPNNTYRRESHARAYLLVCIKHRSTQETSNGDSRRKTMRVFDSTMRAAFAWQIIRYISSVPTKHVKEMIGNNMIMTSAGERVVSRNCETRKYKQHTSHISNNHSFGNNKAIAEQSCNR